MLWSQKNYYDLLEVASSATDKEIDKAFKLQIRVWHPDQSSAPRQLATDRTAKLHEAHATLSDPSKRRIYDALYGEPVEFESEWDDPWQASGQAWKRLASWLKDEELGSPFQRRMAYTAGDYAERRLHLSEKQRPHAQAAWDLAVAAGWEPGADV